MAEMTEAYEWSRLSVLDTDGEKVGTIERIVMTVLVLRTVPGEARCERSGR